MKRRTTRTIVPIEGAITTMRATAIGIQHPTGIATIRPIPMATIPPVQHSNIISDTLFYGIKSAKVLDIKETISFVRNKTYVKKNQQSKY